MRRTALIALSCLALAACQPDGEEDAEVPRIAVAQLGTAVWPPPELSSTVETPQVIDRFAQNNMIVLDMSGSMGEYDCAGSHANRAGAAKAALLAWLRANPGDNTGLVSFSADGVRLDMRLGRGQSHAEAMVERIESLRPDNSTPLLSAMQRASAELEAQAARQGGTGAYRMIVITDGEASSGEEPGPLLQAIADNPANMIEIHTIGFCIEGGHSLNDPGRVFYTDANSPEALRAGLEATQGEAAAFDDADFESLEELMP